MLYVATRNINGDGAVPELVGWDVDTARDLLLSVNLQLGAITIDASDEEEGVVIEQSIRVGEVVAPGTRVNVVVSSGVSVTPINITIPLPNRGWVLTSGRLIIYLDNEQVLNQSVQLNGPRTFQISGRGENAQLRAHLDGELLFSAVINFRANPPAIVSSTDHGAGGGGGGETTGPQQQIPNVVGDPVDIAIGRLQYFGFFNINIQHVTVGASGATPSTVSAQSPRAWQHLNLDDEIVLEVYA